MSIWECFTQVQADLDYYEDRLKSERTDTDTYRKNAGALKNELEGLRLRLRLPVEQPAQPFKQPAQPFQQPVQPFQQPAQPVQRHPSG